MNKNKNCHNCLIAVTLLFGVHVGSAQTNQYLFAGTMTNITLN